MIKANDGGPAFPCDARFMHDRNEGIPVRDYFAAKVVAGLCANPGGPYQQSNQSGWTLVNCTLDQVAEEAYRLADAMIAARGK